MKKNRPLSIHAIGWRIGIFALALWLIAAGLLTWHVAVDLYRQMEYDTQAYASLWAGGTVSFDGVNEDAPGYADYCRLDRMKSTQLYFMIRPSLTELLDLRNFITSDDNGLMPCDFAIEYRDSEGKLLQSSGGSYCYFSYVTPAEWEAGTAPDTVVGYAYIDRSLLDETRGETDNWLQGAALRLTGWFEGNQFHPATAEKAFGSTDDWSRIDRLRWETVYDAPAPDAQALVTIYSLDDEDPFDFVTGPAPGVTIDGTEYAHLEDVLPTVAKSDSLTDAVVRGYGTFVDCEGNVIHARVALRAQPLDFAMEQLKPFYFISLLLMAIVVALILRRIQRDLTQPVEQIARCFENSAAPLPAGYRSRWHEVRYLQEQYPAVSEAYHKARTEAKQLQTALDYAKNAEEYRRQMISNITHELKTPLAIIHSYAEGLSDGIAADRQGEYLRVILEETQRMDAMVLEMLDLSRLEAGKVRLSMDTFSLLGLTRSIFDKLAPVAAEKELRVHYALAEEFDITADEARIGQVITNFATNAIKYTPEGGNIWISVCRHRGRTVFTLENECAPLPEEMLSRVWDSFYRADPSRTAKGTGLGLTIAKAIVELHSGTCEAANTSTGVEFRFTLP